MGSNRRCHKRSAPSQSPSFSRARRVAVSHRPGNRDTSRRRNGRKYIPVDTRYAGLVSLAGISTCSCRAAMHNSVATCSTEGIVPCPATPNNTLRMRARSPARAWCENRSRSRSDMRAPRRGRTFSPRRRASVRISSGKTALATSFVFCIRSATDSPDSRRPSRVS